jgi:hypothetical protein
MRALRALKKLQATDMERCLLSPAGALRKYCRPAKEHIMTQQSPLNPGDEAEPGTPGSGEDICPACDGAGAIEGATC